jgi:hypothetical protein
LHDSSPYRSNYEYSDDPHEWTEADEFFDRQDQILRDLEDPSTQQHMVDCLKQRVGVSQMAHRFYKVKEETRKARREVNVRRNCIQGQMQELQQKLDGCDEADVRLNNLDDFCE